MTSEGNTALVKEIYFYMDFPPPHDRPVSLPTIMAPTILTNFSPTTKGRSRLLILVFSYAPDWVLTIALAIGFFLLDQVSGFRRSFSLEDTSLQHTYAVHERVPNLALGLICSFAPFCLLIVLNLLTVRSWWDFHSSTLGLVLALGLTGAITQFSKITVGRPRPDVIDRCQPPPGSVDPTFGLTEWTICTQLDEAILRDGFRSFPSGHSSLSFAGLGFLAYYMSGKLHLFDQRGHTGKAWLAITPFSAAALVAISRTMDYRHHWHDVLTGSVLGTIVSYFAYRQYYPPLESPLSHHPYSPRVKREDVNQGILPTHHRREQSNTPLTSNINISPVSDDNDHGSLHNTVPRPDPGSLETIWREGEEEERAALARRMSPSNVGASTSNPQENIEMNLVK